MQGSNDKAPKILRIVGDRGYRGNAGAAGPRVSTNANRKNRCMITVCNLNRAKLDTLDMRDPREFVDTE